MKNKKNDKTNILIFAIIGAGVGFFVADYLKQQELDGLKAKIAKNPSDLTNILKEGGGILDTLVNIFKKKTKSTANNIDASLDSGGGLLG